MKNSGPLPMKNRFEIDRAAVAGMYGWTTDEINQAAQAFKAMHRRRPGSPILFSEYLTAMADAHLRPSMIGKRIDQYQFARHGDCGEYSTTNARFVPSLVNQRERVYVTPAATRALQSQQALQRVRKTCEHCGKSFTSGMYGRWHGESCREKR